ncbi:hypothetical protein SADUNF_Sadunf15G0014200 [Salix dunnii]|uniref:Uncharacterized protein n=1 Tax=Salix dunnii TaxID=1413687 RepID=A0A835J9Z9_9ROSI|nr:hypothetical protein SADUNF_Sadunf15G0014200 [Salix dunnii]
MALFSAFFILKSFCFHNDTISLESPLADELFLNGKIVPAEIKNIISPLAHAQEQPACPPPRINHRTKFMVSNLICTRAKDGKILHPQFPTLFAHVLKMAKFYIPSKSNVYPKDKNSQWL